MLDGDIYSVIPKQLGWLEAKLSSEAMDRLWFCIQKYTGVEKYNQELTGNLSNSWLMKDDDDWFYNNVLLKLCCQYANSYRNLGANYATTKRHSYCLKTFWVNFQKQHEFNPFHMHAGCVYSFVIWMKIPYDYREQHQIPISANSNDPSASNFQFIYTNLLGQNEVYNYFLDKSVEGTILFFPSSLSHQVYPFYNCDEERISISGNISLDTSWILE
jgi:hypothetical protein